MLDPQCLYASPYPDSLRRIYAKALSAAKDSIYLSTYSLTDGVILSILNKKAKEGVSVTVLADKKSNPSLQKKLSKKIELTLEHGQGLMHEKILVVDNRLLLLGTANMTYSSLMIHDNLVLGLYDPSLAQKFLKNPKKRGRVVNGSEGRLFLLPDINTELLCTTSRKAMNKKGPDCTNPHEGRSSLEALRELLCTAQNTIDIAMFTLTHPKLEQSLTDLLQKNISVSCAIDKNTVKGPSKKLVRRLRESGAHIYTSTGRKLLHHKWVLIDKKKLIIGSANWTNAAFKRNKDFFIVINLTKRNKIKINKCYSSLVNCCISD